MKDPGVFGARLTGGGFGGSIVILCEKGAANTIGYEVAAIYKKDTGQSAKVLVPQTPKNPTLSS